ncbi:MAG: ABC transporter permease subunit [Rhodospirillaceae bacterium]|nr:ABC transporter permease subunit [Rhodospirillaceae bacterium]
MSAARKAEPSSASRMLDILVLLVLLVAGWELLHRWVGDVALTGPLDTAAYLARLIGQARFWPNAEATLVAFGYGLLIAWVGGVAIGVLLGGHRLSGEIAEPLLVALYSLPKVTLYPLVLLVFGLGLPAKVCFGAIHGIIPVAIFTLNAVRNIKPVYLKTGRSLRLGPGELAARILIPAALPEVVTGLRVGFSLTLLGVLIGEMFASKSGLGFLIINAINAAQVPEMMAVVLLLFLFAAGANGLLLWLDHRLHRRV